MDQSEETWITTNAPAYEDIYLVLDDNWVIAAAGMFGMKSPAGSYQKNGDGSLTISLEFQGGDSFSATCQPIDANSMSCDFGEGMVLNITKVSDPGACQGVWTGNMASLNNDTPTPPSPTIGFTVDAYGKVTSFTGLAGPVSGRLFCDSGRVIGHLTTGESGSTEPYGEMSFLGTTSGNSITGNYVVDNSSDNDPDGSFTLTKQ